MKDFFESVGDISCVTEILNLDDSNLFVSDNDTIEKLYLFAQTGFGRVEIGQQDGAS